MSTHEEIMEVYEQEIAEKTYLVEKKQGFAPFFNEFNGFQFETHPCSHIISRDVPLKGRKRKCR